VVHPCFIGGAKKSELDSLQKTCREELERLAVDVAPSSEVDTLLGKQPAKTQCALTPDRKGLKEPKVCLGDLATTAQAGRAVLVSLVLSKAKVTKISGLVVDPQGNVLDQAELAAGDIPRPSNPTAANAVRTAIEHVSKQLPHMLGVTQRYSQMRILKSEEGREVGFGEELLVQAQLEMSPGVKPFYPERLDLTVTPGGNETPKSLKQESEGSGTYSTRWTPTEEGEYTFEVAYPGGRLSGKKWSKTVVPRCTPQCAAAYEVCTKNRCESCFSGLSISKPAQGMAVMSGQTAPVQVELVLGNSRKCEKFQPPEQLEFKATRNGAEMTSSTLTRQEDGTYRTDWNPPQAGEYTLQVAGVGPPTQLVVRVASNWNKPAVAAYAVGGTGVAAGLLAGYFAINANDAYGKLQAKYPNGAAPPASSVNDIVGLRSNITRNRTLAGVSAAVGVVLMGTGTYLWLSDKSSAPKTSTPSVGIGPGGVGLRMELP
jgi:hypothetical protein